MGRGHLSQDNDSNCKTRERWGGVIVNRNNDSNCRTRERGRGRGHLSLGTMILGLERGGGHLSLGTIILFQVHRERGRGGVMGSFVSRKNDFKCRTRKMGGSFVSRNNSSICRTRGGESFVSF